MDILQPLWEIGKCLWVPLKCRIDYVRKFEENFEKLNREAQDLYSNWEDVNGEIKSDRISKIPTSECEVWLKKVDEIKNKVNGIAAESKENKKCFGELCPNIWRRMKLGKRVTTVIDDIVKFRANTKFEVGVVVDAPPRIIEPTPAPIIEAETSSGCIVNEILRCLREDKIRKIGVWGLGGVGKTTIVKNLYNLKEIVQKFEIVIWVTVSKDWTVIKLQKDIAQRLSLQLGESDDSAASKIFRKLETMKFLLLLDDVWTGVNLEAVGIPRLTRENECKIVLTSRSQSVCQQMETDRNIKVNVLSEKEALDLFHMKAGDVVNSSNIEPLAKEIVKECGGLPLVLTVVGLALRNVNDDCVWSNAITELRRATFQIGDDMEESVFMRLKFSFDQLKNDDVKNCFLYCALYPEDFEIPLPGLIEHWWVEGFIDTKLNFAEAYDKGHAILNYLIDVSLLEKIESGYLVTVKMHDVIRDLALRITSPLGEGFSRFVVKAGVGRRDLPNEEEWEQAERMSLMYCDLEFLPEKPKCNLLTTLLLQNNKNLREMSDSFFENMHNLRVLNLSNIFIKELPRSLLNLGKLQALYIGFRYWRWLYGSGWSYTAPPGIGDLTRLEVLHLGHSIECLPIEVGQLTRLRSLRMEFSGERSNLIPDGLLSRLTLLEDLRILIVNKTVRTWGSEYRKVVEEILSLKQLVSLHCHFPKVEYLEHFLQRSCPRNERRFNSFAFFVPRNFSGSRVDRHLDLADDNACKSLSNLCSMETLKWLKYCYLYRCNAIETFIDGNGLSNLVTLDLLTLPKLRSIWEGPVPPKSVAFLRSLRIDNCPKVSNIFSRGMIQHLSNLEFLRVTGCLEIEEMVSEEDMDAMVDNNDEDVAVEIFPRLERLILYELPKLLRFCKRVPNPTYWPSLRRLEISGCPNMRYFPLSINRAPALADVAVIADELEFEDDATKQEIYRRCHRPALTKVTNKAVELESKGDAIEKAAKSKDDAIKEEA